MRISTLRSRVGVAKLLPLSLFPPPLPLPGGNVGQVWHERTEGSEPHRWLRSVVKAAAVELRRAVER